MKDDAKLDDINLPSLRDCFATTIISQTVEEQLRAYARRAVLADRQKREKPERKVYTGVVKLGRSSGAPTMGLGAFSPVSGVLHKLTLKWDDKGAWIDSERNREIAVWLRAEAKAGYCGDMPMWMREAADALDGGHSS